MSDVGPGLEAITNALRATRGARTAALLLPAGEARTATLRALDGALEALTRALYEWRKHNGGSTWTT